MDTGSLNALYSCTHCSVTLRPSRDPAKAQPPLALSQAPRQRPLSSTRCGRFSALELLPSMAVSMAAAPSVHEDGELVFTGSHKFRTGSQPASGKTAAGNGAKARTPAQVDWLVEAWGRARWWISLRACHPTPSSRLASFASLSAAMLRCRYLRADMAKADHRCRVAILRTPSPNGLSNVKPAMHHPGNFRMTNSSPQRSPEHQVIIDPTLKT